MADAECIARVRGLEAHLREHIIAQDHVLGRVAAVFARGELGMTDPARPRGSFLFVGPTGTGKSETFLCATEYVFGPGRVIRFDMSEYQDKSAVNKFLGTDRSDPGLLGQALAAGGAGALFFDELEKAYPLLLDVFLQMLWDGRVTVATGQTIEFGKYYLGFASNIGGTESMRMTHSTFASVEHAVLRRVRQSLRPELVARMDEVLVFARLSPDAQRQICNLVVRRETDRLRGVGFDLSVSREALEFLVRDGFDPQLGARPLRKTVERHLQDAVVRELFATGFRRGEIVRDPFENRLVVVAL